MYELSPTGALKRYFHSCRVCLGAEQLVVTNHNSFTFSFVFFFLSTAGGHVWISGFWRLLHHKFSVLFINSRWYLTVQLIKRALATPIRVYEDGRPKAVFGISQFWARERELFNQKDWVHKRVSSGVWGEVEVWKAVRNELEKLLKNALATGRRYRTGSARRLLWSGHVDPRGSCSRSWWQWTRIRRRTSLPSIFRIQQQQQLYQQQ